MSQYGVISVPYFPVLGLNTEIYFVNLRIQSELFLVRIFLYSAVLSPNTGKYGTEITPYLDTFHAVSTRNKRVNVPVDLKELSFLGRKVIWEDQM